MKRLVFAGIAFIAGCVTMGSQPTPVGADTYQLSMTGVGFTTQANANMKALAAANVFCDHKGLHMVPKTSSESGVYGWSPRQDSLVFMCLTADDPRYTNPTPTKIESH